MTILNISNSSIRSPSPPSFYLYSRPNPTSYKEGVRSSETLIASSPPKFSLPPSSSSSSSSSLSPQSFYIPSKLDWGLESHRNKASNPLEKESGSSLELEGALDGERQQVWPLAPRWVESVDVDPRMSSLLRNLRTSENRLGREKEKGKDDREGSSKVGIADNEEENEDPDLLGTRRKPWMLPGFRSLEIPPLGLESLEDSAAGFQGLEVVGAGSGKASSSSSKISSSESETRQDDGERSFSK